MSLKFTLNFVILRGLLNQTINSFSSPGKGFPGLPHGADYAAAGSLTVPVSSRQGGQLSRRSLAESKMGSAFQTPNVWGQVCAVMTLEMCVLLGVGSLRVLQMEAR